MGRKIYKFEDFRVDIGERQLSRAGEVLQVASKDFDVLVRLLEEKGNTVESDRLIREVWPDTFVEKGSINRSISTLRKILGDDAKQQRLIKTIPKVGYRFTEKARDISETIPYQAVRPPMQTPSGSEPERTTRPSLAVVALISLGLVFASAIGSRTVAKVDLSRLSNYERSRLKDAGTVAIRAVEDYVQGRALWRDRSAEGLHRSIIHLERAIGTSPDFALAHAALADAYAFDTAKRHLAVAEAEKALSLDPKLGAAYATMGFVATFWERDLAKGERSLAKAIELDPEYPTAHQWYAINLVLQRRAGPALSEMRRALELDPDSAAVGSDLCQIFYLVEKYDEAEKQCQSIIEKHPNFLNARLYLYDVFSANRKYDQAIDAFAEAERTKADFAISPSDIDFLRAAYEKGGIAAFWQTYVDSTQTRSNSYELARYYARLGQSEDAVNWLRKAYESQDLGMIFFLADPVFRPVAENNEFRALVEKFRSSP